MANFGIKLSKTLAINIRSTLSLSGNYPAFYLRPISSTTSRLCTATNKESASSDVSEATPPEPTVLEKQLAEDVEKLKAEVLDYKDKYQRVLADRENVRNRLQKEIADSRIYGIQSFCKDLLEVTDVFSKAIETVPEDKVKENDTIFNSLYDGVVMTENQLNNVLKRHGLTPVIPKIGGKFDPSLEEAMFEVPPATSQNEAGTVAHIVRKGWKLHERCIRSAQVGVFKTRS